MALDRSVFSVFVDDDGSGTTGTILTKAAYASAFLDPVDAEIARLDAAGGGSGASHYCVAYHNTTQTISNGTTTALNLNSEDLDVGGLHDPATNNSRITIPSGGDGVYLIHGRCSFAPDADGTRQVMIFKNGSTDMASNQMSFNSASGATILEVLAVLALVATNYVEIRAYQTSGGDLAVGSATRTISAALTAVRLA